MRRAVGAVCWLIVVIMALPVIAAPVMADGVSWTPTSNSEVWSHVQERAQFSIINFHDGYEKMIVTIQVPTSELESGTRMFWLFPVPSNPQDVKVDLISDVPRLEGSPYSNRVIKAIAADPLWIFCVLGSQLWPVFFASFYVMSLGISGSGGSGQNVNVFVSADKYGLHSEVLSANNASNLQAYLASQGLTVPSSDMTMLADYVNSGYSFVSTRIDNLQDFKANATSHYEGGEFYYMMGVETDFPTDQLFFPLKLTSAYGESNIPITVQVLDFVDITSRPTGSSISIEASYLEMDNPYSLNGHYYPYSSQRRSNESINQTLAFFDEQIGTDWASNPTYEFYLWGKFTEIRIDGMASSLNNDLWMNDNQPSSISTIDYFISNSWIFVIMIFLTISTIAGLIVGYLLDGNRKHFPEYLVIGLSNVLTVFVPTLLYWHLQAKWFKEEFGEEPGNNEPPKNIGWKFFGFYTMTFLVLTALAWGLVSI